MTWKVWKYVEGSASYVHVFLCFYRHFWLGKHFDFVARISFSIPNYFSFEVSVLKLLFGWFEAFWMKVWNDEVMMTKIYMTRFSLTLNHCLWWGFPRILIWLTSLHNFLISFRKISWWIVSRRQQDNLQVNIIWLAVHCFQNFSCLSLVWPSYSFTYES